MPLTFRIHNPKKRSERVLIKMVSNRPADPSQILAATPADSTTPVAPVMTTMSVKSKKKISISQLQEILKLVQKSKNKDLLKVLSSSLVGLIEDDADVDIDEVDEIEEDGNEAEEVKVEEVSHVSDNEEDDEDVLVIEI